MTTPTREQVVKCVMALLECSHSELDSYSPELLAGYENDVRRVLKAASVDLRSICIADENTLIRVLADRIAENAHPEENSRLDIAYAIARHLKLDWPSAYDVETLPRGHLESKITELEAQLKAAQEDNAHQSTTLAMQEVAIHKLRGQLASANQYWQVAEGRCDALTEKLALAEQRSLFIDPSVVISRTRRVEILEEYIASRSDGKTRPDLHDENHVIKLMKLAVEEYANRVKAAVSSAEQRTAEACAALVEPSAEHKATPRDYIGEEAGVELLTNVAKDIRSGLWRKFVNGE